MPSEAAFLAAIATSPDDDLPRLVFADWLEENGQKERADYIRLAIHFDPHRDRFDDGAINELRQRLMELEQGDDEADRAWQVALHEPMRWDVIVERRRGFVDSVALPVQWWLQYGDHFRQRFPTLRKLVLFRLNGWGERLAACVTLRGIRELELACWYGDADAVALANCTHLHDVERLVLWSGGTLEQASTFARSVWPRVKGLHLVSREGLQDEWVRVVKESAGRPIATVYHFGSELFPFAPDFDGGCYGFHIGQMQHGAQLFALGMADSRTTDGWLFHPDGRIRQPFRFEFPPELVIPSRGSPRTDVEAELQQEWRLLERRQAYLSEQTGFTPAFIRVQAFTLDACELSGVTRFRWGVEERWGALDDPDVPPEADDERVGGFGAFVYKSVTQGEYSFDFGNDWWCDRTGHVTST